MSRFGEISVSYPVPETSFKEFIVGSAWIMDKLGEFFPSLDEAFKGSLEVTTFG